MWFTHDTVVYRTHHLMSMPRVQPATEMQALGLPLPCGHLHPLLKVRSQFRKIFTQMGFTEMPTNNYVESSFWNFDALFQPQQHPARDAHDTFFLTKPAATPSSTVPQDYLERVRTVHESGGFGSAGCAALASACSCACVDNIPCGAHIAHVFLCGAQGASTSEACLHVLAMHVAQMYPTV